MGIFDDMENFLFDRFSVTKRHNVQHRVISISSSSSDNNSNTSTTSTSTGNQHHQQQQLEPPESPPSSNQRLASTSEQQDGPRNAEAPSSDRSSPSPPSQQQTQSSHLQQQQTARHQLSHQQLQRQMAQRNHQHQRQQQQQFHHPQTQHRHHHHQHQQHSQHHQYQQHPHHQIHSHQQHHQQQQQQQHNHHQPQQRPTNSHKQLQRCSSYPQAPPSQQHHPPIPRSHSRQDIATDLPPSSCSPLSSLPNSPPTIPRAGSGHIQQIQMSSTRTDNSPSSHRRSAQVSHSRLSSSSPFRDRMSWHESRSRPPTGHSSDLHSPQQEHRGFPSPARSRHRASWVELSNLAGSFDFTTPSSSPHPLRRSASSSSPSSKPGSPTSSAIYNNVNNNNLSRPPSAGALSSSGDRERERDAQPLHSRRTMSTTSLTARSPSTERPPTPSSTYDNNNYTNRSALPPSPSPGNKAPPNLDSPTSPQKQNFKNETKTVSLPSTFRSEPQLASLDRPACMVAGDGDLPQFGLPTLQTQQSNGVVITKICRPKLVRLRSEPSSPFSSHSGPTSASSSSSSTFVAVDPQSPHSAIRCRRRRRDELKRSQSLEVTSSGSCQEELWTGINVPSQLVITRPQLSRADVNRRHLSLHLDYTNGGSSSCCAPDSFSCMSGEPGGGRAYPPLLFHETHGDNIQLLNNKSRARRHESFCKGICFSNRPVHVNEKIYVKFVETNTSWSGVLRFGFTSIDPATIQGQELPRYACPDLTNKPGNWAKALGERYTTSNILLHFSVNANGDVAYGVNGEDKGVFFSSVVTSGKLWAMLDVYGNTVTVEFSNANAAFSDPEPNAHPPRSLEDLSFSSLSLDTAGGTPTSTHSAPFPHQHHQHYNHQQQQQQHPATPANAGPPIRFHASIPLSPMPLHALQGRNIRILGEEKKVAARLESEYSNSLVFSSRPMKYGETIVIQVLGVDRSYLEGLGFGLTACNPSDVEPSSLPDDSDYLLDRLEYWVVNKDVCSSPEVGDELSFFLSVEGEVMYSRNQQPQVTLMHVDRTLPLWMFFDVYGNIQKIKILGCTTAHIARPTSGSNRLSGPDGAGGISVAMPSSSSSSSQNNGRSQSGALPPQLLNLRSNSEPGKPKESFSSPVHTSSVPATPSDLAEGQDEDCHVCYEQLVNCVIYKCGHMCLCYSCADQIKRQKGQCPICRNPITDIIKVYRS